MRRIFKYGTGHAVEDGLSHLGTFQLQLPGGPFVGHVFERPT